MRTYVLTEKLGEGVHGHVYKARDTVTGEWVALKKTWVRSDDGIPSTALREVSILRTLDNPHVVKLKDIIHKEKVVGGSRTQELTLVFEYIEHDLKKFMDQKTRGRLDMATVQSFCYQILHGLEHCHSNSIMHRDLKPQNILVSEDCRIKIADFGLGRVFSAQEGHYTEQIVTLRYRSPEVLLGTDGYSTAVDIWSVGCILAEMITGTPVFMGDSEIEQLLLIFRRRGTPTTSTWPKLMKHPNWHQFPSWEPKLISEEFPELDPLCADVLERMLQLDPTKRITASEALCHPFFRERIQRGRSRDQSMKRLV
eukprot:CAMPEP_0113965738 /NCGR_PEP_ID=MMETSP0011_2-20120614/7922_1 /TAXON_ID=101924 /ORGANISM="Rhodosorus marinus" /LENGTH=310 /DNA_ID=CAMNT_0000978305 /DNA_START=180 /DNA_END=1109 /DNA_ORIENTATION=+ /assembly_acc=CAM_ASM_000156